jgi:hypothetical protein
VETRPTHYISIYEKKATRAADERGNQPLHNGEVKGDADSSHQRPPQTTTPNGLGLSFAPACILGTHTTRVTAAAVAALRFQFLHLRIGYNVLSYNWNAGQNDKYSRSKDFDINWNPNHINARQQRADLNE